MRYFINIIIFSSLSSASLLDFKYLQDAKDAYSNGDYKKAEELYSRVESDESKFNRADALYRQKRYKEAIDVYKSIDSRELEYKKLHNIGNSYANLKEIDKAIKSYEDALEIKDDKDTRFNLELLKKRKEEQKKEQEKRDKKDNKQDSKENKDKNRDKQDSKENRDREQNREDKEESKESKKDKDAKEQNEKSKESSKKEEDKDKQRDGERDKMQKGEQNITQPPISNMEERKWQKMLNKRGVNTLMLPLNGKGAKRDETNPW